MEYLELNTDLVPKLGFGTWQITGAACVDAVRDALEIGYRHLDTAQMYGNEEQVGEAIAASGVDRDEIFLTTFASRTTRCSASRTSHGDSGSWTRTSRRTGRAEMAAASAGDRAGPAHGRRRSRTGGPGGALLVVDLQPDFLPGGELAVADGDVILPGIAGLMQSLRFDVLVATQDWHPPGHASFASSPRDLVVVQLHGRPAFLRVLNPPHPRATSRVIITAKPRITPPVAKWTFPSRCDSGISSSATTKIIAPAANASA
jgi:hypothetical protein